MDDFANKLLKGNGIKPPVACVKGLSEKFEGAINIDWFKRDASYEAVFYKDESEYIALFNPSGSLMEYKQYLPVHHLPQSIKNFLESKGEIMNIVLRNKGNRIEYEAIIRDLALIRYLVILSDQCSVIEERKL